MLLRKHILIRSRFSDMNQSSDPDLQRFHGHEVDWHPAPYDRPVFETHAVESYEPYIY
jgi:hypothetical protein